VPVIAAIEGRAHVHSDLPRYLASVIVAAEGATFRDVAHFSAGRRAPGDGNLYHLELYRAGAGRAEAFPAEPTAAPGGVPLTNGEWFAEVCAER